MLPRHIMVTACPIQLAAQSGNSSLHAAVQIQSYMAGYEDWHGKTVAGEAFAGSFEYTLTQRLRIKPVRGLSVSLSEAGFTPPTGPVTGEHVKYFQVHMSEARTILRYSNIIPEWPYIEPYDFISYVQNVWGR